MSEQQEPYLYAGREEHLRQVEIARLVQAARKLDDNQAIEAIKAILAERPALAKKVFDNMNNVSNS